MGQCSILSLFNLYMKAGTEGLASLGRPKTSADRSTSVASSTAKMQVHQNNIQDSETGKGPPLQATKAQRTPPIHQAQTFATSTHPPDIQKGPKSTQTTTQTRKGSQLILPLLLLTTTAATDQPA